MKISQFAALFLAFALPCPSTAATPAPPRPALWKLADRDTTIYLFGTVHALPKDLRWNTGLIRRSFQSAKTLVVEVAETKDAASLEPMLKMGIAAPGSVPPLIERVPERERAALNALAARAPFPREALDRFETWLAALFLVGPSISDAGLDPETGADRTLMADARKRGLPVIGLETMAEQLGYFDGLPEADQRALLEAVIEDDGNVRAQFKELVSAWARGDVAVLEHLADDELKASPHIRDVLLTTRNARWADWLAKRLDTPGTVFVAVGAGHLTGDDSIQHKLAAKGLKVTRLQ